MASIRNPEDWSRLINHHSVQQGGKVHHIPTTAVGQAQLARRHQSSDKRGFGPGEEDGPGQGIYHYSVAVAKAQTTCSEETVHDVSVDVSGTGNVDQAAESGSGGVQIGRSLFFTRRVGTGKSYLLRKIISTLPPDETVAPTPTVVSECLIGGTTLTRSRGSEKTEAVGHYVRKNDKPFSGIQLILCGDYFQLSPVVKEGHACP
ncbi:conserved hypothetical protein [Culex quinquefasciatus]|uniref:ATP-dependent DNA helicase n=1 Tax=Culex quinquefasciatus TaxID=7176 RepID=B0WU72_CULQU|nr:conserved hypothetical protein [Culex quinquefasciatus]|eukprot:XP_001858008.1 conserved hypothetical protein [Culex quinquefasciatus]